MKRVLTAGLAAHCLLFAVHCGSGEGKPTAEPTATPELEVPGAVFRRAPGSRAPLVPIARIEGYGDPATGELWARAVPVDPDGQPANAEQHDGVQAAVQPLSNGYCSVMVEADGKPDTNPAGTFEFYTKGQLAGAPSSDLSSFDATTCYNRLKPGEQSPLVQSLFQPTNAGVGCALQHVGNFSGVSYDHVYLDIDVFNGDETKHGAYGPPFTTGVVATPPGRNAPNAQKGLWDFGPMSNNALVDMWIYFKNGDPTDFNWTGYLLGERSEDCNTPVDDDCDGVINNGCGGVTGVGFAAGADCYANEDCNSFVCQGAVVTSSFGKGGPDLADDVPGTCMGTGMVGEPCSSGSDCQAGDLCYANALCVRDGSLRFTLSWQTTSSDYDLHVLTPHGYEIYGGNTYGDGGQLDFDDCDYGVCKTQGGTHVENIEFPSTPPLGAYSLFVNNNDPGGGGPYTIEVHEYGALVYVQSGTLAPGEEGPHFRFAYPSSCGDGVVNTAEQCDSGPYGVPAITSFSANNCVVFDHASITGDNRGGIAVGQSRVLYSGDAATGSFDLADPSASPTMFGDHLDGLVSDLATGQVFALGTDATPLSLASTANPPGSVNSLMQVDEWSGSTYTPLSLSQTIAITTASGNGVFAGPGFAGVVSSDDGGSTFRLHTVDTSTGEVQDAGQVNLDMAHCENWAAWGIADVVGKELYLTYVSNSGPMIVRTQVSTGYTVVVNTFANLGAMCSISESWQKGRWYFHHDANSQFWSSGNPNETIGYCDASFTQPEDPEPGCSDSCQVVAGYTCSGEPSSCTGGGGAGCTVSAGTVSDYQLSTNGYLYLSATQRPGQSFTLASGTMLTGIEVGLSLCNASTSEFSGVKLELLRSGLVIASATIPSTSLPTGCGNPVSLGSTGASYFDLSTACVQASGNEELVYRLSLENPSVCQAGLCTGNSQTCASDYDCMVGWPAVHDSTSAPYPAGAEYVNDSPITSWDGVFKVFTADTFVILR